jgi:hypothetical protein
MAALRRPIGTGEDGRKDSVLFVIGDNTWELEIFLEFFRPPRKPFYLGKQWKRAGSRLSDGFRIFDISWSGWLLQLPFFGRWGAQLDREIEPRA